MKKETYLNFLHQHLGLFLFFTMLLIALMTFDNYGMGWDESAQRETGNINYDYVFSGDTSLLTYKDKDYGVAFELPLIILEKVFNPDNNRNIFLIRHLVTHCFFLVGCYFLFLLIDYLYKNKLLATVAFFLLILHPRIYAHSFFNSKDVPFLSMFIISLYYSVKAFDKKDIKGFIILGICAGLLVNFRIMGVIVIVSTILILLLDLLIREDKQRQLSLIVTFIMASCVTLYVSWPFLWLDPIHNFIFAFENMSRFRWGGTVLFKGDLIRATELDWTYIPTWFTITTPIVYLVFGFLGISLLLFQVFKTPFAFLQNSVKRTNIVFLGYFLAPLLAVVLLQSELYDGWRQMFFIYPFFILLIIYGLSHLFKKKKVFIATMSLIIITFIITAGYMIRNFPLQGVYFSEIFSFSSPEYLRKNFEMDYWGVSYKQSLEYILKVDSRDSIDISLENTAGRANLHMLPARERKRFNIVSRDSASYFITNYRSHPQDYSEYANFKFHSLIVEKNTVNEIFKLK